MNTVIVDTNIQCLAQGRADVFGSSIADRRMRSSIALDDVENDHVSHRTGLQLRPGETDTTGTARAGCNREPKII